MNMRRVLFLAIVLVFSLLAGQWAAAADKSGTKTVVLTVENMTCAACPITVRKALEKVPGVIKATADYGTRTATVTFDPARTGIEALTEATANAGYPSAPKK